MVIFHSDVSLQTGSWLLENSQKLSRIPKAHLAYVPSIGYDSCGHEASRKGLNE